MSWEAMMERKLNFEKRRDLLHWFKRILLERESRLEEHVGVGAHVNCTKCYSWKAYDGWKVDYCVEAERLAYRVRLAEERIKKLS